MAVVVRRHVKRGPYGRVYWEDAFRERLRKRPSCGVCCGRQWWTSWGGWGKRRPSAALLAGGVDNDVSQWCKEGAAVDIYLQRAHATLFFLFFYNNFVQTACNLQSRVVKRSSRFYYSQTLDGMSNAWQQPLSSFMDTPWAGAAVCPWTSGPEVTCMDQNQVSERSQCKIFPLF